MSSENDDAQAKRDAEKQAKRAASLREIKAALAAAPAKPVKPDALQQAREDVWKSISAAARFRLVLGWILTVLFVLQVVGADYLIYCVADAAEWKVDAATLAAMLGTVISEVAAIT